METIAVLFTYSISVYGIAWILTKSRLFSFYRNLIHNVDTRIQWKFAKRKTPLWWKIPRFISKEIRYFSNCIVCNSAWVGALISISSNNNNVLYTYIGVSNPLDLLTWVGYSCGITWLIASKFGDAD